MLTPSVRCPTPMSDFDVRLPSQTSKSDFDVRLPGPSCNSDFQVRLESQTSGSDILAEAEALDFAGRGLGQLGDELDPPRTFVVGQPLPHELLKLGGKRR